MAKNRTTILIADKDKIFVDLLMRSLASEDLSVFGATTAEETARLLDLHSTDLLVIDPAIPNAFPLIRSVQAHFTNSKIVGVTSSDEMRDELLRMAVPITVDRSAGLDTLVEGIRKSLNASVNFLSGKEGVRILVADDEQEIRNSLAEFLSDRGYVVSGAPDGREALECVVADRSIQMVLLDVSMPRMGGIETLRAIMALDPHPGVIMMTAVADREIARQALKAGAFDYILKPYDFATMEASIAACMSHAEYQKQPWWKRLTSR